MENVHELAANNVVSQLFREVSQLPLDFLDCSEQCALDLLARSTRIQADRLGFLVVFEHTKAKQQLSNLYFLQLNFDVIPF